MAAAGPLHVVRVDGAPADGRHRVLQLGGLVEAVRVEAHRDVALVRVAQDPVDEVRVRAVVLVNLEAGGAGRKERVQVALVRGSGARLHADVDGPRLHPRQDALHGEGRLLEARGDERGHATRERRVQQLRGDGVDVGVDGAGRGDQPVRHVALGVGADDEIDAVADRRAAGAPDARDAAVLDADVRLDDAQGGVDDEGAGEDDVKLRGAGGVVPLGHPGAEVLGVAPDGLVAAGGAVLLDLHPEVRVAQADAVAGGGAVAGAVLGGGEPRAHRPASLSACVLVSALVPAVRTRRTVLVSPGSQPVYAPAAMSRW